MGKEKPDHVDADLVLRVYELRREIVMRESRVAINREFWPKTHDDLVAVTRKPDHPLNAPFRQVATYWEMVYGMAHHAIVHADYFVESNGEGLYLYAKVAPFVERLRQEDQPMAFRHAEWMATECATGRRMFEVFRARVLKVLETK